MKNDSYMYTKETNVLQISYAQYISLQNQYEEAHSTQKLAASVFSDLQSVLAGIPSSSAPDAIPAESAPKKPEPKQTPPPPKEEPPVAQKEAPAPEPEPEPAPKKPAPAKSGDTKIAPIKKEIAQHFKKVDGSGQLFEIFKDYYTLLNESCGGMMRVTMKDGICSLWNYDEWEEFAFVDISNHKLRLAVSPRYAEMLKPMKSCEVPRLLARKRKLIGVEVEDLNELILDVLAKAFAEAGSEGK